MKINLIHSAISFIILFSTGHIFSQDALPNLSVNYYMETSGQKQNDTTYVITNDGLEHNYVFEITASKALQNGDAIHITVGSSIGSGDYFHGTFLINNTNKDNIPMHCYQKADGNKYQIKIYLERIKKSSIINYSLHLESEGRLSTAYTGAISQ